MKINLHATKNLKETLEFVSVPIQFGKRRHANNRTILMEQTMIHCLSRSTTSSLSIVTQRRRIVKPISDNDHIEASFVLE